MTEHLNVETLWPLLWVTQCYQGSANGPEVIDHPPRDGNGYVTFGCFNNFARVSDRTLATWWGSWRGCRMRGCCWRSWAWIPRIPRRA